MEPRLQLYEWEIPSYILAIIGVTLDHFSTNLGLTRGFSEANIFVTTLMDAGLWLFVDAFMVFAVLIVTYLIIHHTEERIRWIMIVFPLILGFCRMAIAVFNFILIL